MVQNTPTTYTVQHDEIVTIKVVATRVGEFVVASLDGGTLEPIGSAPLRYRFSATKPLGQNHFTVLFFHFPDSAPDDANYQIFVQGSQGGGQFTVGTIVKSDPPDTWNTTIEFSVA